MLPAEAHAYAFMPPAEQVSQASADFADLQSAATRPFQACYQVVERKKYESICAVWLLLHRHSF